MPILESPVTRKDLAGQHCSFYESMTKAVVDLGSGKLAVDAEMHADLEQLFLEQGALQANLWGINLYPAKEGEDFLEFTSLINIRPGQGNASITVQDPLLRSRITGLVRKWVQDAP